MLLPPDGNGPYRVLRALSGSAVKTLHASVLDPKNPQLRCLAAVLDSARGTDFGQTHNLSDQMDLNAYRDAVPIRTYDEMQSFFTRTAEGEAGVLTRHAVKQLLVTSGTTGPSKYLPVTAIWEKRVAEAQALWRLGLVKDREEVSRGKVLTLVSPPVEGVLPSGLAFGSNTGRMHARQPWIVRMRYPTPKDVVGLQDPMVRLYCTLRFALQHDVTSITTANPSTILLMARRLEEWADDLAGDLRDGTLERGPAAALSPEVKKRLGRKAKKAAVPSVWKMAQIWNLVSIHCWKGGSASFFIEQFSDALGGQVPIREVGITASEGYFALPLSDEDPGGVAWLGAHLLEFVGEDGQPRWAWELEVGKVYRLIISTTAGLYRYDLGDLVEVVGKIGELPSLRFVRKATSMLNVTGEKVSEDQVLKAAQKALGLSSVVGLTARIEMCHPPRVELAVEWLPGRQLDLAEAAVAMDSALRAANVEYDSKRKSERLGSLKLRSLSSGSYARYRAERAARGAPDAQVKDLVIAWRPEDWAVLMAVDRD